MTLGTHCELLAFTMAATTTAGVPRAPCPSVSQAILCSTLACAAQRVPSRVYPVCLRLNVCNLPLGKEAGGATSDDVCPKVGG